MGSTSAPVVAQCKAFSHCRLNALSQVSQGKRQVRTMKRREGIFKLTQPQKTNHLIAVIQWSKYLKNLVVFFSFSNVAL